MKKQVHHIVMFNYQNKPFIFEHVQPSRLFVGDLLRLFADDLKSSCLNSETVTDLEVVIDDEGVMTLAKFAAYQSTGSTGARR